MKKNFLQYIPFGIALTLILIYVIQTLTAPVYLLENSRLVSYSVIDPVKYASIGLGLTFLLIILRQDLWKYVFLLLIILSFTGLVQFTNHTFSFVVGAFNIEIIPISLLILHIIFNSEMIPQIELKLQPNEKALKKRAEQEKQDFERSIDQFKRRFNSKSKNELETIVEEKALVPAAVEAAKRLLIEQNKQ